MDYEIDIMPDYVNKDDEVIIKYKNDLKIEINKLVLNNWNFLNENWKIINYKYKHRTEIKYIKLIDEVKEELLNKLGYTSVFFFLNVLYSNIEYPSPYIEIEKGLMLLFHLTSGYTSKNMKKHVPYTSFYAFYKKFWITNYDTLNKKVNHCLLNMFSNLKIRILSALIKNPKNFKNITLLLDGHDSSISYDKPDISIQKRWSYKLKSSGIRTQVVSDINDMVIYVSYSDLCGKSNDGSMFLNMKLYNKILKQDCVAIDGGYTLFIKQFEDLCNNKGYDLDDNNFFYPIRKEINEKLNEQEIYYNKVFGSFRSKIENQFQELFNKFKRFSNNNSTLKTDDIKYINLQIKVAFLLKNIEKFCDTFNIITQEHHKLWKTKDFDFPQEDRLIDIVYNNEMKQINKFKILTEIQNDFLKININENMIIDESINVSESNNNNIDEESDIDFPELKQSTKKRKKRTNKSNKNIESMRNINKDDNIYEIENIIEHKIENNNYVFFVKWKGYNKDDNSWVKEKDFYEKQIIKDYLNKRNIIY